MHKISRTYRNARALLRPTNPQPLPPLITLTHPSQHIIQFTVNAALKFVLAHMAYAQRLTPALSDERSERALPHLIAEVY